MTPLNSSAAFHAAVRDITKELRTRFELANIPRLMLEVEVSGQSTTGDMVIEFRLRDGQYGEAVRGGTIDAILDEFLRRKGWKERNAPLCLPRVEDIVVEAPPTADA